MVLARAACSMTRRVFFRRAFWGVWMLPLFAAAACSDMAKTVRSATYPPDFAYIERANIRTEMHTLAAKIQALDAALREPEPSRRDHVRLLLVDIERTARGLQPGRSDTNHPLLDAHLPALIEDVVASRRAVEHEPPSYFLAGSVVGSCVYCHR